MSVPAETMQINFHGAVTIQLGPKVEELNALILSLKAEILTMANTIQESIDELAEAVAELTSVDQSAIALINGFAAQLAAAVEAARAAGATPAQLAALSDLHTQIHDRSMELAAAVTAGTPANP